MGEGDEEFYDAEQVDLLVDSNINFTLPSEDSESSSNVNETSGEVCSISILFTNVCVYCF